MQHLTDWMGDEGWLKTCYAKYTKFVYLSDVLWLRGKVNRKYVDPEGEFCVEVGSSTQNQRKEEVMPGRSTVVLPSREKKTWPLERRLGGR